MLYVTVQTNVRRRPEIVWDVLTDIAGLPTWIEGLVEAKCDDEPEEIGAGSRLLVKRRHGKHVAIAKATSEITVWKPNALLVVETRASDLLLLDRVTLTPTVDGTEVRFNAELIYGNKLIELLARPRGLLLGRQERHPVDDIYERSVAALIKRIETIGVAPYR